ncbi:hypothetical protein BGX26_000417, partial [Mortierella sp. AD094]
MTTSATPVIRARNAQYQSGQAKRSISKRSSSRTSKPSINLYLAGFLLLMLSGGAIFQVLKLAGLRVDDDMERHSQETSAHGLHNVPKVFYSRISEPPASSPAPSTWSNKSQVRVPKQPPGKQKKG